MHAPSPVYLDNNATTAVDPAVRDIMDGYWSSHYANPSSPYTFARAASLAVARAREQVAALVGAAPDEIVFTSGGTESNNTALLGALALHPQRRHIVTTSVEHASVREVVDEAERRGYRVTRARVERDGRLDLDAVKSSITGETAVVSVMTANNETGVIYPVADIAAWARAQGALFHTDAVQAVGKVPFHAKQVGADLVALGAHKLHGPKGVGALFVRREVQLPPLLRGGEQEQGRRAGTENVPGIAGFGCAADLARGQPDEVHARIRALRDAVEARLASSLPGIAVVGAASPRLANTALLLIERVETDALLAHLDLLGICCSSGSACASGAHEPSHVLRAMGLLAPPGGRPVGVLRVSLSRFTGVADVESLVDAVVRSVNHLRG